MGRSCCLHPVCGTAGNWSIEPSGQTIRPVEARRDVGDMGPDRSAAGTQRGRRIQGRTEDLPLDMHPRADDAPTSVPANATVKGSRAVCGTERPRVRHQS
ncbi:unnamed protein product [Calypogeia fissa]